MINFLSFLLIMNVLKTFIIEHINNVTDNEAVNEKMNSPLTSISLFFSGDSVSV